MKKSGVVMFVLTFVITTLEIGAQNLLSPNAQIEIGGGCIQRNFIRGSEHMLSDDLRNKGLTYYFDTVRNRKSVDEYSPFMVSKMTNRSGVKCFETSLYF